MFNFLKKNKTPKPTGHIIVMEEHHTWGDNLYWWNYPGKNGSTRWTLGTHATRKPEKGDEVRCNMESGKIGRWIVTEVEYVRNPPDMFFAECLPCGYVE